MSFANEFQVSRSYVKRVLAVQLFGIVIAFFTIWLAIGGLSGAIVAGLVSGLNAISLKVLLALIRQGQ